MDQQTRKAVIARAAALLATDPAAAEREAVAVRRAAPHDPNATLILAAALRRQGRAPEAIPILEALARDFPRAPPTHYELGMSLADTGRVDDAVAALKWATEIDPEYAEAWRALGAVLFDAGDARAAEAAYAEHDRALVREPHLKGAALALYRGGAEQALGILQPIVQANPGDLAAVSLLAEAHLRAGQSAAAAALLERLLEQAPDDARARFRLASALIRQQRAQEALAHLERLLALEPENPALQNLMAGALAQLGQLERAIAIYERLLQARERHAITWASYGHALRMIGRTEDAVGAYRRALALDRGLGEAYLGLANLKVAQFSDEEARVLRRLVYGAEASADERAALAFALGQALEDRSDHVGSMNAYLEGAALRRLSAPYDADAFSDWIGRSIALFDRAFFEKRAGFGAAAPDPIFIVGLPRSGSTLVEQILASHSAVEGVAELPEIGFIADRLADYPDTAAAITAEQSRALGEGYLAATSVQRQLDRAFFIDKMPNNFQFVGLIQLILPNAKIIDVRRHPMATCFSAFKQHFAEGQAFSYDLADLGRYYRDYLALMDHFDRALPGRIIRVIYEDLVEDAEAEIRRLLGACGLEFEPACLAFHETERAVRTASSAQVRQPIFREGLEQWRNFAPWLGPLQEALGPALESWRGG
jgi:predicted Zn-dependent protease